MHIDDHTPTVRRWHLHKEIIREACRQTRDYIFIKHETSAFAIRQTLTTISRAVWRNDINTAYKLIASSFVARSHVKILDGKVSLVDPDAFDSAVCSAQLQQHHAMQATISSQLGRTQTAAEDKRLRTMLSRCKRMSRLWSPSDKRLVLNGILCGHDSTGRLNVAKSSVDITRALSSHWAPVFSLKTFDEDAAMKVAADNPAHFFCGEHPPGTFELGLAAKNAKNSPPGCDGIPNRA